MQMVHSTLAALDVIPVASFPHVLPTVSCRTGEVRRP